MRTFFISLLMALCTFLGILLGMDYAEKRISSLQGKTDPPAVLEIQRNASTAEMEVALLGKTITRTPGGGIQRPTQGSGQQPKVTGEEMAEEQSSQQDEEALPVMSKATGDSAKTAEENSLYFRFATSLANWSQAISQRSIEGMLIFLDRWL